MGCAMDKDTFELLIARLDDQKAAITDVKRTVEDGFKAMNGRVRATEKDMVRIKTILGITGTTLGAIFAWMASHWHGFQRWLITP